MIKTPFDELIFAIIGCAMAVPSNLGPGLRENSYQHDLVQRTAEKQLPFEVQKVYEVLDGLNRDALIGYYIPDIVVSVQVVVEIKALPGFRNGHTAQVIGYMAVNCCPLGQLINFRKRRIPYCRAEGLQYRPKKILNRSGGCLRNGERVDRDLAETLLIENIYRND